MGFAFIYSAGSVALLNLTDSEAYLTGFVTEPKHRRLGIGFQLFDKAISFAKGRRVMINSDPKVFEKYERYGFTREFYLHKMSGILTPWKECNTMDASCLPNVVIGHVTEDNIQDICLYDERISGIKRKTFLRMILMASNTITACAFSNCGAVVGLLALCKVDSQQVKMFSFYANDAEIAGLLLREVVSKPTVRGCYLKLFLPEMNPESEKLFRLCGLERDSCGFKLARMNNRDSHTNIPWRSVFCICCSGYFYV